ncbi:hypothetical protein HPP92_019105 [Vanilla planifolia]|uniref:Uncharacterized protein n=1 Tax=Vanilla planifolia TaxID=51239 RepID=A0A835Q6B0_VANPL|nr:hypothetical protein HPP92_019105 [Vanilla planifolia]
MASEGVAGGEDMDGSLFEGMVLFSPADLLSPEMPPTKESSLLFSAGDSDSKHLASSPYRTTEFASSTSKTSLPKSQPLDEDLFSDLTIQAPNGKLNPPIISSDSLPKPSLIPPSRQISRKKKRAVRIGYGREAIDNSAAIPAEGSSFSYEDSTLVTVLDASCRAGAVGSESASETLRDHQELHDQLRQEEATEAVQEVASPSPVEIAGEGISPLVSDDTGGSERLPLTVKTSEKEDFSPLIEEKLVLLKARISDKLDCIQGLATSLCTERKELQRRRRNVGEDFKQAAGWYRKFEKELEEACETEDFERAERVSESLGTAEKEKNKLLSALRRLSWIVIRLIAGCKRYCKR